MNKLLDAHTIELLARECQREGKSFSDALFYTRKEGDRIARECGLGAISQKELIAAIEKVYGPQEDELAEQFAEPEKILQAVPYPVEIFKGTLAGEFAERCTKDNYIPSEVFIEPFLAVLGSVMGNRVSGNQKGMQQPRHYCVLVAKPQNAKDTAIEETLDVFRCADEEFGSASYITGGGPSFNHIGAKTFNPASENAIVLAGLKCMRLLALPQEFGSLYEKSSIQGSGNTLAETFLGGWDSSHGRFSTSKKQKEVPERFFLSLLTSIQPDRLQGMPVKSGLFSRVVWVTYPELKVKASLARVQYGDFQKRLFERLNALDEKPYPEVEVLPESLQLLNGWWEDVRQRGYKNVEVIVRMNIYALRRVLLLAWLREETTITPALMKDAILWCEWQLVIRCDLFIHETVNVVACWQQKILKTLRKGGYMTRRNIYHTTHAEDVGTVIFQQALDGLLKAMEIKSVPSARRNTFLFGIPKEEIE